MKAPTVALLLALLALTIYNTVALRGLTVLREENRQLAAQVERQGRLVQQAHASLQAFKQLGLGPGNSAAVTPGGSPVAPGNAAWSGAPPDQTPPGPGAAAPPVAVEIPGLIPTDAGNFTAMQLAAFEEARDRAVAAAANAANPAHNRAPNAPAEPAKRGWGPEQATGAPDTHQAGDIPTAWATRDPDAGTEWLQLDFDAPAAVASVVIYETYNPGAISRITALAGGQEVIIWEGVEPSATAPTQLELEVTRNVTTNSIIIYLDTTRVSGWNEIDAVQLVGRDGSAQWAARARASSTYADRAAPPGGPLAAPASP